MILFSDMRDIVDVFLYEGRSDKNIWRTFGCNTKVLWDTKVSDAHLDFDHFSDDMVGVEAKRQHSPESISRKAVLRSSGVMFESF